MGEFGPSIKKKLGNPGIHNERFLAQVSSIEMQFGVEDSLGEEVERTEDPDSNNPKVIICGGNGGVGKMTTTSSLAIAMASTGHNVAVLSTECGGESYGR
eukprot:CAMPEP_0172311480 /NCGR_PEP_ID=MMETSP1058-20130122/14802_1 /TAXON_ID=83371 /ORGANISM="Detonula confervacea, Strain CCMP 353" /LENGTH=99 /DNA_ID=CAMNT_0013024657 /DNA_START=355 /DNA_END=658 /DNA_ORIENTATION=-